jgi:hypothetical protein
MARLHDVAEVVGVVPGRARGRRLSWAFRGWWVSLLLVAAWSVPATAHAQRREPRAARPFVLSESVAWLGPRDPSVSTNGVGQQAGLALVSSVSFSGWGDWFLGSSPFCLGVWVRAGWGPVVWTDPTENSQRVVPTTLGTVGGVLVLTYSYRFGSSVVRAALGAGGRAVWVNRTYRFGESAVGLETALTGAPMVRPSLAMDFYVRPGIALSVGVAGDVTPPFELGLTLGFRFSHRPYDELP